MFTYLVIYVVFRRRLTVHNDASLSCGDCGRYFSQPWLLDAHQRPKAGYNRTLCPICKRFFMENIKQAPSAEDNTVSLSIVIEDGAKSFAPPKELDCQQCGQAFSERVSPRQVLNRFFSLPQVIWINLTIASCRQHEGACGSSFSCFDCGRYFPSPILLSLHIETRPGEVRTKCTACGRCYKHRSSNLKWWKHLSVLTMTWRSLFFIICTNIRYFLFNASLNERYWIILFTFS